MEMNSDMLLLLAAFAVSFILTWLLSRGLLQITDIPNHRSLHSVPTPRTGGLAIAAAMFAVALASWLGVVELGLQGLSLLLAGWFMLLAISVLDDIIDLSAPLRLLLHLAAAAIFLGDMALSWWQLGLLVLLMGWCTNLFNFMDGMDGLAGSMGLVGAATLAILLWLADPGSSWLLAAVFAAAIAGFLPWNLPPARIFLGEAGSVPAGVLLAGLAIHAVLEAGVHAALVVLPFLTFLVDATLTLLARGLRGERVWQAHREHCYQRLCLAGFPVYQVLMLESALVFVNAGAAIWLAAMAAGDGLSWSVFGLLLALHVMLFGVVVRRYPREPGSGN